MSAILLDRRICFDSLKPLIEPFHPKAKTWRAVEAGAKTVLDRDQKAVPVSFVRDYFLVLDDMAQSFPKPSAKTRLAFENTRTHVMSAVLKSLPETPASKSENNQKNKLSWRQKVDFWSLFAIGTFYAASLGVTGIRSVLTLFHLPFWPMLMLCSFFGGLSIFIYYGFDLRKISAASGIPFLHVRSFINAYVHQQAIIDEAYRRLLHCTTQFDVQSPERYREQLAEVATYTQLVDCMHKSLKQRRQSVANQLRESTALKVTRYSLTSLAGLLYASAGFFIGKGMATVLLGLLITPPTAIVTTTCIAVCGMLCAYAAYRSYRQIEQANLGALVGRLAGLPAKPLAIFQQAEPTSQLLADTLQSKLLDSDARLRLQTEVITLKAKMATQSSPIFQSERSSPVPTQSDPRHLTLS